MAVTTTSGTKISIGPTTAAANLAAYVALSYVEIEEVENIGEIGDQSNDVTFLAIADARVRHLKGARDAGVIAVVCGRSPLGAGQAAVKLAETTKFAYAFKVELLDKADANDTNSFMYFHAIVQSARSNLGGADDVTKITFNLGVTTAIFEAVATVVP